MIILKALKDELEDMIAAFRMKSRSERVHTVKKLIIELAVIAGLVCSPALISIIHGSLQRKIYAGVLEGLSVSDKWELVRKGKLHVECLTGADAAVEAHGMDPSTPAGLTYAIDHGFCLFVPNE
jgi:hypothetical protein